MPDVDYKADIWLEQVCLQEAHDHLRRLYQL